MSSRSEYREYIFLGLAHQLAQLGTCCLKKVGCVIVDEGWEILSYGYNGVPRKHPHCTSENPCYGARNADGTTDYSVCRAIHAEQNALMKLAIHPNALHAQCIFITTSPCAHCMKLLMNTNIQRIVCGSVHDQESLDKWTSLPDRSYKVIHDCY
jgi:dCMP deaminase